MISSQTGWGGQKAGTARQAFLSTSPLRVTATTAVHRIGYRHRQQSVECPQVQMPAAHPIHPDRNRIPCPIVPPGRTKQAPLRQSLPTSFASSMGHALLCSSLVSKGRLAPCNRPQFQFPMPTPPSSCQIAEQPLTDQRGRYPPLPACTVCAIPCGARGRSTGCAACQPFSGRPFPFSCTTPRALFSSPDLGRYRSSTYPCPWRGGQHV